VLMKKETYRFFVDVEAGSDASMRLCRKIERLLSKDREMSKAGVYPDPTNIDTKPSTSIAAVSNELRRLLDILVDRLGPSMIQYFAHALSSLDKAADRFDSVNETLLRVSRANKLLDGAMITLPMEINPANLSTLPIEVLHNLAHAVTEKRGIKAPFDYLTADKETLLMWLEKHMFSQEKVN
jgi:hypothetical protein